MSLGAVYLKYRIKAHFFTGGIYGVRKTQGQQGENLENGGESEKRFIVSVQIYGCDRKETDCVCARSKDVKRKRERNLANQTIGGRLL